MNFKEILHSKDHRFEIGEIGQEKKYCIAITVRNSKAEYAEFYIISDVEFERFKKNINAAIPLVESCKARNEDHRLYLKPGKDRGFPV